LSLSSRTDRAWSPAIGLVVLGLSLASSGGSAQGTQPPAASGADALRLELTLDVHTLGVSVPAGLRADAAKHRGLLAAGPSASRVAIGQLQTNGALRSGAVSFAKNDLRGLKYDVWLEGSREKWQLELVEVPDPKATAPPASVPKIELTPRASGAVSPTLVAALVPADRDAARLVLRWGDLEATAEMQFTEPQRLPTGDGRPNQLVNRKHDEDTSALSRLLAMTQRNESVVMLPPKGSRLSVSFARTLGKGQRSGAGATAGVTAAIGLGVDGPDFARLTTTPEGAVVQQTMAAIPRLVIEAPLRFGRTLLRTANQAPGTPGTYGLWLKRTGRGWRLVVSSEPDTWGSQHDRRHDVAEIELIHAEDQAGAARPFAAALVPTAPDRGRLVIQWGAHEWTAEFVVAG
jgi:hypothetical protein